MVLTITVVGNGQGTNGNRGHAVLSPNELAQLMSGQTVTGLLNPDGSITLNSNAVMSTQPLTSVQGSIQNGPSPITSSAGGNYQTRPTNDQLSTSSSSNSISNIQAVASDSITTPANNHSQTNTTTTQKKTGQKRLTAKQKLALQQQQQQQQPPPQQQMQLQQSQQMQQIQASDPRHMMTSQTDQSLNQQPQIVATVQLPNGQIGQLIAPSGGQFWSPNAINLQQLSMAVAAATGTMPQTMSVPCNQTQPGSQMGGSNMTQSPSAPGQMQQGAQQQQQSQQLQQSSQPLGSQNQQQVLTAVQLPNDQIGSVMGRPGPNQIWSGGPISLSQLSALAQQGVVQLSPVQGIPTTGPNSQRVVEMIPQSAIQGLISQTGQPLQTLPLSSSGQFITQDPNDPGKWQIVSATQVQTNMQGPGALATSSATNSGSGDSSGLGSRGSGASSTGQSFNTSSSSNNNSSSQNNPVLNNNSQSTQPQRKLKRLACTCPNCRDGDNSRNGSDKKKQHICHFPDCNKVYGKTSHLRAHLRWHSGERPYVCNWSFCGKKFTRSDELQRHRRTHTGEKRFQCSECLKRFMRSDHLSKHLKTHLSTKKSGTSQQQANGLPTIVTLTQEHTQVKIEQDMIDELALESLNESNDKQ